MIKKICRWILRNEIFEIERHWWRAGVNQQLYDSESAEHGHMTYNEYWGYEE